MTELSPAWEKALDEWAAWSRASGHAESTIKLRRTHLRNLALTVGDDPWATTLGQLVVYLGDPDWADNTRHSVHATLRSFFTFALTFEYMDADPTVKLPRPRQSNRVPRPAPDDVFTQALSNANDRDRLILLLAAYAGLRRAEIAALKWEHVADARLRIKGKGRKTRLIPIHPALARELGAEARRRTNGEFGSGYRYRDHLKSPYVFPGRTEGANVTPRAIGMASTAALGHGYTCHTLRHRFATRAYMATRDLLAVQELLGHSSAETTRVYTGIPSGALEAAVLAAGEQIEEGDEQ